MPAILPCCNNILFIGNLWRTSFYLRFSSVHCSTMVFWTWVECQCENYIMLMSPLIVFGNDTQKNGSSELLFNMYINNRNWNGVEICSILFYSQCNSTCKLQDKRTCFLQSYFLVLLHFSNIKRQDYFILLSVMMFYISFSLLGSGLNLKTFKEYHFFSTIRLWKKK